MEQIGYICLATGMILWGFWIIPVSKALSGIEVKEKDNYITNKYWFGVIMILLITEFILT